MVQVHDEQKRQRIRQAAAAMFASRPYHKVRLEDIAAEAAVGKGTVYTYFKSKDDLYLSLVEEGFAALVEGLQTRLADPAVPAMEALRIIVAGLVEYAVQHPHLFELMRTIGTPTDRPDWERKRRELYRLIERTIRRGVASEGLADPHPELTALFVPGFVRAAMMRGGGAIRADTLVGQIMRFLQGGLEQGGRA